MGVTPGKVNLLCPQGSTFSKELIYIIDDIPVDLSGYSGRLQVRQNHFSPDKILDLFSPTNGITLGGSAGTISILVSASTTAAISAGDFLYDLELESSGGIVGRIIEGSFIVTPEVTR